ncbi:MAG: hypothetical protein RLZZ303_1392 [Candidatus Hydrogenedentota bacterium]
MSGRLVTVCTLTTQAEADLVESVLRAAGIPIVHDHEYGTTSGFADTAGIHIAVREEDVERAREALSSTDEADV